MGAAAIRCGARRSIQHQRLHSAVVMSSSALERRKPLPPSPAALPPGSFSAFSRLLWGSHCELFLFPRGSWGAATACCAWFEPMPRRCARCCCFAWRWWLLLVVGAQKPQQHECSPLRGLPAARSRCWTKDRGGSAAAARHAQAATALWTRRRPPSRPVTATIWSSSPPSSCRPLRRQASANERPLMSD